MNKKFTFNDISLVPAYADFGRNKVDITSKFDNYDMRIPIISSPMDTLTGITMMSKMNEFGVLGAHHRYCDPNTMLRVGRLHGIIAVAPSVGYEVVNKIVDVNSNPIFVLDVAHGHTGRNLAYAEGIIERGGTVISGNIATESALLDYYEIGVRHFRCGIGGGSVCLTRKVAGVGIPQASVIVDLSAARYVLDDEIFIISDGGHKTTGDIIKALALGADFVMLGGMLSGTDESIDPSRHSGMASKEALTGYGKKEFLEEGITKKVEPKGSVIDVLSEIELAIKQGCYYTGAKNLKELKKAEYIFVTENGYLEGLA